MKNPRLTPKDRARAWVALALGVIGAASSAATIYAAPIEGVANLSCGVEALNCGKALTSDFAKIGGVPLGVFGVFYFALWTLNLRAFLRHPDEIYQFTLSYATLLGVVVSLALAVIMFGLLRAPCLYCLVTHLCNLLSFWLLWPVRRWRFGFRTTTRDHVSHFLAVTGVALLGASTIYFANEKRLLTAQLVQQEKTLW